MKVFAVIVTYRPDLTVLSQIVATLAAQCRVVVADNTPGRLSADAIASCVQPVGCTYAWMGGNIGIGAAQNRGIAMAWALGADAVLLLDDDSMPPEDLVKTLAACSVAAGSTTVVGANAVDEDGREISNARRTPGGLPPCRDMMSSGTLIPRVIFDRVGPFDETLFLDCVDFEWGWRARRSGIGLRLCRATSIVHRLGEGRVAGVGVPAPIRHYYQYRNVLRLIGTSGTPWGWKVEQMVKLPTKLIMILLFMSQRRTRLRFVAAGVRDAVLGCRGAAPGAATSETV